MLHEIIKFIILFQYDDMLCTEKEQGYEQKAEWHFFLGVVFFGNAGRMQQHNI